MSLDHIECVIKNHETIRLREDSSPRDLAKLTILDEECVTLYFQSSAGKCLVYLLIDINCLPGNFS